VKLLVYAITGQIAVVGRRGLAGERLQTRRIGRLTAVIAPTEVPPATTTENLRRYDLAIARLADDLPSILPARFPTVVADEEELAFILRSREPSLREALRRVRGRAQFTIRMNDAEPSPPPPLPSRGNGTAYLRWRRDVQALAAHAHGFDPVRAAVQRWVKEERVERHAGVVSVYRLVPRRSAAAYRAALVRAAADAQVRCRVTGPFPPYAFTGW